MFSHFYLHIKIPVNVCNDANQHEVERQTQEQRISFITGHSWFQDATAGNSFERTLSAEYC
jgi:hypothetical protein